MALRIARRAPISLQDTCRVTAIGDTKYFEKIETLTTRLSTMNKDTGSERLERVMIRLERAKQFVLYIDSEYEDSMLKKNSKLVDSTVQKFFASAHGKLVKQAREVEKSAERVFGKSGS